MSDTFGTRPPSPPTVGRVVHYRSYGTPGGEYTPECRAAVVTEVPDRTGYADQDDQVAGLAVLQPDRAVLQPVPPRRADDRKRR